MRQDKSKKTGPEYLQDPLICKNSGLFSSKIRGLNLITLYTQRSYEIMFATLCHVRR